MQALRKAAAALMLILVSMNVMAATTQSTGAGSAVTLADRTATFDSLTASSIDLSAYSEDGLFVTVDDVLYVPFNFFGAGSVAACHYGWGGNESYVTIKTTDALRMYAVEAKIGSGYGSDDLYVYWETWANDVLVSSGSFQDVKGVIAGWTDPLGFDELRIAAQNQPVTGFGDEQAIALDDVSVNLQAVAIAPVPTLAPFGLLLMGLLVAGLGWAATRRA